jgi:hypothetical protein
MSDNENTEILDLDINLADVDTSNPSLAPGKVPMTIVKADVQAWKNDPSKKSLVLQLKSINEETGTRGETLPPGMTMFYRANLQQNDSAYDFRKDLAKLSLAAFGEQRNFNRDFILDLPTKVVLVTIKPAKNTDFGETEIKALEKYEE